MRGEQPSASLHQVEVGLDIGQLASCASGENRLTWTAALLGVHGTDAAHKGCKVSWCPVSVQVQHQAPKHLLCSLCLKRSCFDWFGKNRIEVDTPAAIVQLRNDGERQELGPNRFDNLLFRFVYAARVDMDVRTGSLRYIVLCPSILLK